MFDIETEWMTVNDDDDDRNKDKTNKQHGSHS
jgi:hypothetical protein